MSELNFQKRLHKYVREQLPGYELFKHRDEATAGIPDTSITGDDHVTWFELKFKRKGKKLKDLVRPAQLTVAMKLSRATTSAQAPRGRCWFVVRTWDGVTEVWHPRRVLDHVRGVIDDSTPDMMWGGTLDPLIDLIKEGRI